MFTLGMKVIWLVTNIHECDTSVINSGTITKLGKSYGEQCMWIDNAHKAEDGLLTAFAWPDTEESRLLLNTTLLMAARHKQESKDLMSETFKLRNRFVRKEL